MHKQTFMKVLLGLLLITPLWGVGQAAAQGKAPARVPKGQTTITDAAGRLHVRQVRPSYAQRKAAAQQRIKALRAAAAKKTRSEVKK